MSQLADLILRYYETFNRRDFAAYDRLFTPDCLIEAPGIQLRGIDGARGFDKVWTDALPDGKLKNLHIAANGNVVLCENRIKGTHKGALVTPEMTLPPTGRVFDEAYMATFELEGERIKRQSLHFDRVQVMKVMGTDIGAQNIETVKSLYEAFGRGDLGFILDRCTENVSWGIASVAREVPAFGVGEGKQQVAKFAAAWGETVDFTRFEASDFNAVGPHVYCTLNLDMTVRSTGKRITSECSAQHWRLEGGKVVSWRGWQDTALARDAFTK